MIFVIRFRCRVFLFLCVLEPVKMIFAFYCFLLICEPARRWAALLELLAAIVFPLFFNYDDDEDVCAVVLVVFCLK